MRSRILGLVLLFTSSNAGCIVEVEDAEEECESAAETLCDQIDLCAEDLDVDPQPLFRYETTPYSTCVDSFIELLDCPGATSADAEAGDFEYCASDSLRLPCNELIDPRTGTLDIPTSCQ